MKTSFTKTMLLVMIAMVSIMMVAQIAKAATIAGSKHDLGSGGGGTIKATGTNEVCVFCHTPHAASTAAPLWNRSAPAGPFTMYNNTNVASASLQMTVAATPQGVSAACLSCHDGATSFDALTNKPGSGLGGTGTIAFATATMPDGVTRIGTSLINDHPISITYDNTLDTAFNAAASGKVTFAGKTVPLFGSDKKQVECASCHNVHDNTTAPPFLRFANTGSALCLTCHIK